MEQITIVVSTNRRNSESLIFAQKYEEMFRALHDEVLVLRLQDLSGDVLHPDMYTEEGQSDLISKMQDKYMIPASKFFFVLPEYNGGMPGILKLFIDACSVRNLKESFAGKKAALAGVAAGRAGNLRGMEHLTAILNFLGVTVLPNRLPISSIHMLVNSEGNIVDEATLKVMEDQVSEFLKF